MYLGAYGRPCNNGVRTMAIGAVKWFNDAKSYGFIIPEEGVKIFLPTFTITHKKTTA